MLFCLKVDKEFFLVCVCLLHGRLTFLMLHSINTDVRDRDRTLYARGYGYPDVGRIGQAGLACRTAHARTPKSKWEYILGVYHVCIASHIYIII